MLLIESSIKTKNLDYLTGAQALNAAALRIEGETGASVPQPALVSNFDVDQRGFLTEALQGYTAIQTGRTGTLAVNADYGISPRYQNPDTLAATFPYAGGRKITPQPGQPVLAYRAAAGSPNASILFTRGGKAEPYREYPDYQVGRNYRGEYGSGSSIASLIYFRSDAAFVTPGIWGNNSPLPPGVRWAELNDILYENTPGDTLATGHLISVEELAGLYHLSVDDISQLLPQDRDGRPKVNARSLPGELWSLNPAIYTNDSYWTGQVLQPLDWNDSYWYGTSNLVDKAGMEAYLNAHPGCRFA